MCETGGRVRASGRVKLLGPDELAPERRESVRATWTPLLYLGALGRPRATPRRRTSVTRNACSRSDALVFPGSEWRAAATATASPRLRVTRRGSAGKRLRLPQCVIEKCVGGSPPGGNVGAARRAWPCAGETVQQCVAAV